MSNTFVTPLAKKIATPGLFARYVSQGTANQWKMARHMAVLDKELTDIETGANDRLIVQMPPRHGKSFLASGYFPAHYLGMFPNRNVIMCGATADLALEFSGMARDLLTEHGWMFGVSVRKDRSARDLWQLEQGGICRAAGVGGAVMGRGADLLIIDDYFKDVEDALSETMRTKLYQWYLSTSGTRRSPTGAIVVMATRWHGKDLIGQILSTAEQTGEKWRVINFPALGDDGAALWPEQWPASLLEKIRAEKYASGYPWIWEALYQQNPPDVLDAEWPPEYFEDILTNDWPEDKHVTTVALDPSLGKTDKADYSAFVATALGYDGVWYIDANIARRSSTQQVEDGIRWMRQFSPNAFGCETNQFQELLADQFAPRLEEVPLTLDWVFKIHNDTDKLVRIRGLTSLLAKRKIKIRRSPGSALLLEMLRGFPNHKFKDGPDAMEMAIRLGKELLHGSGQQDEVGPVYAGR
jgi:predicted phage terminase large subunit-like protein